MIPSGEIRSQSLSKVNGLIEITTWNKFSIRLEHFSAVIFMCNDVTKKKGSFILSEIFQHVNEVWGTTQKIRQKKSRSIFQTFHNIAFSNLFLNGCELYAL